MAPIFQQPEITFAQRLASNEKTVRSKALKALMKYINLRSQNCKGGFTNDDLLKLWKGLFYCLWMQDKPILQEELSNRISGLIHNFQTTDSQLLYLETFLQTLKREWNGIDRLRLDKFYQLVRFMFRQVFEVLKRREWDTSVMNQFLEAFTRQLLERTSQVPHGLMLHILDLYLTELACVGAAVLMAEQNLMFIDPFCKTMAKTKDRFLLTSICDNIFRHIREQAPYAVWDLMKELQKEKDEGSDCDVSKVEGSDKQSDFAPNLYDDHPVEDDDVGPVLQFDYSAIADQLFELGSSLKTQSFNRKKMYGLVKVYRNLSEGIFPQDEINSEEDLNESSDDELFNKKKRKRNNELKDAQDISVKKSKACENGQKQRDSDQNETSSDVTETKKNLKKKKKKRHSKQGQIEIERAISPKQYNMKKKPKKPKRTVEIKTEAAHSGQISDDQPEELCMDNQKTHSSLNESRSDRKLESPNNKMTYMAPTFRKNKKLKSGLQEVQTRITAESEHISNTKQGKTKKVDSLKKPEPSLKVEEQTALDVTSTMWKDTSEPFGTTSQKRKKMKQDINLAENLVVELNKGSQHTEDTVLKWSEKRKKATAESQASGPSAGACTSETDCILHTKMNKGKKKRKVQTEDTEDSRGAGSTDKEMDEKVQHTKVSLPVRSRKKLKKMIILSKSHFISFQGLSKPPTPLFCKIKPKPRTGIKNLQTPKPENKKVTFGLKNNKTTEFRKNDRSLLVSPVGLSRVAFDPTKKPASSVIKSSSLSPVVSVKKHATKNRATAADFF